MTDIHLFMQKKIEEHKKKNPKLSYRFISTHPDDLQVAMQVDGWKPVKEEGSGVAGEVKIGDLILAARPVEIDEEQRKREATKGSAAVEGAERQFYEQLAISGGYGRYLQPLTPEELERRKGGWSGGSKS